MIGCARGREREKQLDTFFSSFLSPSTKERTADAEILSRFFFVARDTARNNTREQYCASIGK